MNSIVKRIYFVFLGNMYHGYSGYVPDEAHWLLAELIYETKG